MASANNSLPAPSTTSNGDQQDPNDNDGSKRKITHFKILLFSNWWLTEHILDSLRNYFLTFEYRLSWNLKLLFYLLILDFNSLWLVDLTFFDRILQLLSQQLIFVEHVHYLHVFGQLLYTFELFHIDQWSPLFFDSGCSLQHTWPHRALSAKNLVRCQPSARLASRPAL